MKQTLKNTIEHIARNIRQIRELKGFSQDYMALQLEITQPAYHKIENGETVLKIDRLQQIADILGVDVAALMNPTTIFHIVFHAPATQSGYINSQTNTNTLDIETLRKIIREEIDKKGE